MGLFFKRKVKYAVDLSDAEREEEIVRLEKEREEIDEEIETLLSGYAGLTRDTVAVRGARRKGYTPKDMSYWGMFYDVTKKNNPK